MDARRPHMVVLRGVGVLLVLLLGSVLALVQPASAAPALIATESPRPPDNVQADHTGMIDDDPHPPDSTPSAISDDDATTRPTSSQNQDPAPAHSDSEAASQPSAPGAPETNAPPMATPTPSAAPSAPSPRPAPAATPPVDSSVVVTVVDPEDDGFSDGSGFGDEGISAEAGAAVATTMAVAIPSAPSIHTVGGLLAYTGAGLGLTLAMVCLLVIGALALWRSRREETTPAFF
mgnify:CR=1 FL=1